jgi:hypothetical protein
VLACCDIQSKWQQIAKAQRKREKMVGINRFLSNADWLKPKTNAIGDDGTRGLKNQLTLLRNVTCLFGSYF